ncbi:hypothetical protein [Levilactobacillus suantsaii]|uniref:Uncharacterized protein n=1 Tax=Levilactobacillus suantsaii TaxID=2292255 RepID=A0A4Q0VJ15_9LACO|nr:hypothetical protein [Levilactobacillus suantsaii]QMU08951.1 hypothetical protein H3M12_04705 [Levilactobacillus suantsaii]RXI77110.1 hypothetical protein DXH47_09670 [Levilactobacillus suantsaii]
MRAALECLAVIWAVDALVLWWVSVNPLGQPGGQGHPLAVTIAVFLGSLSLLCVCAVLYLTLRHPTKRPPQP